MLKFYWKMQYTKLINTIVCVPDLVIIKYFRNNTIEIKRIVFTYPDLLPSDLIVGLELALCVITHDRKLKSIIGVLSESKSIIPSFVKSVNLFKVEMGTQTDRKAGRHTHTAV